MTLDSVRTSNALLRNLTQDDLEFLESVSWTETLEEGEVLFEEGRPADTFYVISAGKVALEVLGPGKPPMVIQTLGRGEMIGLSWLFPPHRWNWRARAWERTSLIAFDGVAVRNRCADDDELARRILESVSREVVRRLQHTRIHLLDLYRKN